MADDRVYASRLHPDDLAFLAAEMRKGAAAELARPDRPQVEANGRDAAFFRTIIQEEVARDRGRHLEECRRLIHDEVNALFDDTLPEKFAIIGLRIDSPDAIEKTRLMLDGLRRMQAATGEFKSGVFKEIIKAFGAWIALGIAAVLGYLGIRGGSH